ncbi:MAG: hypothetical protein JWM26_1278 [Betaproteobacteria bacterium]|jgi:hypothetical protein|nr:hypothetical protein [Betaproteobacteria bacterium]
MKTARLFSIQVPQSTAFVWKWRCSDGKAESKQSFDLYYDCVEDARKNGYSVELTGLADDPEREVNARPDLGGWSLR